MGLPVSGSRQAWQHDRLLFLAIRNAQAAKRFLGKAPNGLKQLKKPEVINTDKAPTYAIAISELKTEGKCPEATVRRLQP
jgi:transposase-like protein